MKNLKSWLNRNNFSFEVKEGFTGNELIFINVETLAAEQVKRIKTYLKRYKFNFEYWYKRKWRITKRRIKKI